MSRYAQLFALPLALILAGTAEGDENFTDQEVIDTATAGLLVRDGIEPDAVTLVQTLNRIAVQLYKNGESARAELIAGVAFRRAEQVLGPEHAQTLFSINNLGLVYAGQGHQLEAEQQFRRALAGMERILGAEHQVTLRTINNLALACQAQGRDGEAESLFRRALKGRERALGLEHPETLNSVADLADLYRNLNRYEEAEPLYRRALEGREQVLGAEHPVTLATVNNMASLLQARGRYGDAEPLFLRALDAAERVLGPENRHTLIRVNNLAVLYKDQGRYDEAEALYRRALAADERVLGHKDPVTLTTINNFAELYKAQGRYKEAESFLLRAVEREKQVLGPEHPDTLTSINNLAELYKAQGRLGEAEQLFGGVLVARWRVLGEEHPQALVSLIGLGNLYVLQVRYEEAEVVLRHALDSQERVLGTEDPQTLATVGSLAELYRHQGRYEEADPLLRRALKTCETALGREHPQTLAILNNLAVLYRSQGRDEEAEPLLRSALDSLERVLGTAHSQTHAAVNNLGELYRRQGRYEEAESFLRRALDASDRVLGKSHPGTLTVQENLALALISQGHLDLALDQLREIDDRLRTFVGRELQTTRAEQVRRQRLAVESGFQNLCLTLPLKYPVNGGLQLAANILLRWKRLVGEQEALVARMARSSENAEVRALAEQLQEARAIYSRLVNLPDPKPEEIEAHRTALTHALGDLERLEVALATHSGTLENEKTRQAATWQAVENTLPTDSALLELRAFRPFDFKAGTRGEPRWLALVLEGSSRSGKDQQPKPPRLIDLGPVAASDADRQLMARLTDEDVCLARYLSKPEEHHGCSEAYAGANFTSPESAEARAKVIGGELDAASARFYAALLGPLDQELAGYETLYIAPDGVLDLVPFARLKLPDGRYWVERQTLRQVRSGRDLIAGEPVPPAQGLLALGAVDYDAPGPAQAEASPLREPDAPLQLAAADTDPRHASAQLRAACGHFSPLPETEGELGYLKTHFAPDGGQVLILEGRDASEARLKRFTPPPRVLHLATHGCFAGGAEPAERPMTLSLLALAGANQAAKSQPKAQEADDGILHALEVLDLDLTGTELVALSACDTGKGEVDSSEGVYGLVRAFQIAGAANVLMTLRPLNDALAAEFMADFYRTWLDRAPGVPEDPALALRRTQLDWLASERPEKRDPRHWAPYALVERL